MSPLTKLETSAFLKRKTVTVGIPAPADMIDIHFTSDEQYKFDVITKVLEKQIKPGFGAKLLGISTRQVRRLKDAVRKQGKGAVVHHLKGKKI